MSEYLGQFETDIRFFNGMYQMPAVRNNIVAFAERLNQFEDILKEECKELNDLFPNGEETVSFNKLMDQIKVSFADLLGDIIVYCASEARRWNIPIDEVLRIIMASNFSKMGPEGPIYDERDKLLKGPNYWEPKEKIAELLANHVAEQEAIDKHIYGE